MLKLENLIQELTTWIDEHIHEPLKIDDVAVRAGYSKWHLQRVFFEVQNIHLGHYIRDRKLACAAQDLLNTQESVIDVSLKYGFDSQQSFTRTFSRKYSLPPSRYRRQQLSEARGWQQ
ncbi:transcriptional regulator [Mangrovibacter sp. MFB070]|uniref:helix-turn-helix domain-containing protein n=1 Tax=Mangrovibacter sp. MFB070 TaxID=1224318 RepID=UPI0004D9371F|nr:helix-turn-helix domain-containing protein [Mangrovibacter sp. MFB070]KEA51077.1 transcriptional regulator [Mangrovibacter sp. MFB070]